ncbi:14679_t:CDS:2, partial [Entrophospora sp. SA101]
MQNQFIHEIELVQFHLKQGFEKHILFFDLFINLKNHISETKQQLLEEKKDYLFYYCLAYLIQLLAQPLELTFELSKGWALKGNQKYGQKGGGNRMSIQITSLLESFFLAGEADKTRKYTAETMLGKLNSMVEEDEIDKNEVPKLQTI